MDNYAALFGKSLGSGGGSGTDNYNELQNKPSINGTTLSGNKTAANLGLQTEIKSNSKLSSDLVDDTDSDNKFVSASDISTWNGKQDAISDLSTIRSGAAAGATAVQPAALESGLAEKVDNSTYATDKATIDADIAAVANAGAKNILENTYSTSTVSGVKFTVNDDGTVIADGINQDKKATANITNVYISQAFVIPDFDCVLSGCPDGGAYNKYQIDILDGSTSGSVVVADHGDGVVFRKSMFSSSVGVVRIRIQNGQVCDNLIFKPMIQKYAIKDKTYQPYAPTNRELYEMILALQSGQSGTRSVSAGAETLTKGSSEPEVIEDEKEMEVKE